ncbi:hypothetical protein Tco_0702520 [Tanacetum coccineum]|uniref:Uncharacterized protein n=1 Tax=Tanacetum coccineum TaxID=301880 RepID=A0ABQ4XW81_9ASTR
MFPLRSIHDYLKAKDKEGKIKIKDPRSQECERNCKGIPTATRLQDLRHQWSKAIYEAFLSSCGCHTNLPLLLKNLLKSLTAIGYSSSSLLEEEVSSSLDSFLAFRASDLYLSFLFQMPQNLARLHRPLGCQ